MALWGQGDARWIVEEREDAKNVNNWHWSEVDASSPSKTFLKEKFLDIATTGSDGSVRISEVTTCNGEATVNNRKGKVIYFFEWNIELKWCGKTSMSNDNITGKVMIENVSEENTADEVDISTRPNKSGAEHTKLNEIVKTQLLPRCREVIADYIKYLQVQHGKQVLLPTNKGGINSQSAANKPKPNPSQGVNNIKKQMDETVISQKKTEVADLKRVDVNLSDTFKCTVNDLFQCFVNPDKMTAYFQSEVKVHPTEGGQFSLMGGTITGTFLEIDPDKLLHLHWRFKDWPEDMFSSVTLKFKDTGSSTELSLSQVGVPQYSVEQIKSGWSRYYFNAIKMRFGYGSGSL